MKNIALLVSDFMVEHCQEFISGVMDYFNGNPDVRLFITQTQFSDDSPGNFEYQHWTGAEILKSKEIDAYIFLSGVYCSVWSQEQLNQIAKTFGDRPIISACIDLDLKKTSTVKNDCKKSFLNTVTHLKDKHGCKKIAFLSAVSTGSPEAKERFEFFKEALAANNLEFDESRVFDGAFMDTAIRTQILERYTSKEEVDFDAVVSSNDMMAIGCQNALEELGLNIPNDVKIIGFDDAIYASITSPKFSTVNQNIFGQGRLCAEQAMKAANGEEIPSVVYSELTSVYRQSCGCIDMNCIDSVYKDYNGNLIKEKKGKNELLDLYINEVSEKHKFVYLLDLVKASNTLRQLFYNIEYITDIVMCEEMTVCIYDEPVYINRQADCVIPEQTEVMMYFNMISNVKFFKPGIVYNPMETVCPTESLGECSGSYIIMPIFSGEANYGYICCKPRKNLFGAYTINLKILISAIAQAYEYTHSIMQNEQLISENNLLITKNTDLSLQSRTDELTKLLNRRGFMEFGQRAIDVSQEMGTPAIVFFADMDGLKSINDTYGHKMGDKAISAMASVLRKSFRASDVIGRLSGDEFGIVANVMTLQNVSVIREKILKFCESESKANNLPFKLSISMGAVNLESSAMLTKLLVEADKVLYEEKRIKHSKK